MIPPHLKALPMETLALYAGWIVGCAAAAAVIWTVVRRLLFMVSNTYRKGNAAFDTLIGREAIVHPDTGVELVPATPGLGQRLASMEYSQSEMREAIVALSQVHQDVKQLALKVEAVDEKLDLHITEATVAARTRSEEQVELYKAVRAVAMAEPPEDFTD